MCILFLVCSYKNLLIVNIDQDKGVREIIVYSLMISLIN